MNKKETNVETSTESLPFAKLTVICPLPCPFCGSDTEIETTTFGDSIIDYFRVNCKQNGHSLDWWVTSKEEAIAVWNGRE